MSFNEQELLKIKKATSRLFKRRTWAAVAASLVELKAKIASAKELNASDRDTELKRLMNEATSKRQAALRSGARSYGHTNWATAAACESWLHELVLGDSKSIARLEAVISEMLNQ